MPECGLHSVASGCTPSDGFGVDPLDEDADGDCWFQISDRQLVRVALVAVEVGARFQRDALPIDPMTWLLTPRPSFGGRTPLEASLCRDRCLKMVIAHGLSASFADSGFVGE